MIKAIIFDLDGVLFDEKEFVMSGFHEVSKYLSKKHNLDSGEIFKNLSGNFLNGLRKKNFDVLLKETNLKDEKVSKLIEIYRNHKPHISLYEDAAEVLPMLRKKYKLGIITDGRKKTQENKIHALSIKDYFDVITINTSEKKWKPNTDSFFFTVEKLGVKPWESVYIGDDPTKDFFGCRKIGTYTIRIRRGNGLYDHLDLDYQYEADYTVSDLLQVNSILRELEEKIEREKI